MGWTPESVGNILYQIDGSPINYIYNSRGEWIGVKDLTGNGNHLYWNKPQERLEAFFRRIVVWLDKYVWREQPGFPKKNYVHPSRSQLNQIGRSLADRFNTIWTDIK